MKNIYIASALLASSIISGCGGSEDEGRLFGGPVSEEKGSLVEETKPQVLSISSDATGFLLTDIPTISRSDMILINVDGKGDSVTFESNSVRFKYPGDIQARNVVSSSSRNDGVLSLSIADRPSRDGVLVVSVNPDRITNDSGVSASISDKVNNPTEFILNEPSKVIAVNGLRQLEPVYKTDTFRIEFDRPLYFDTSELDNCAVPTKIKEGIEIVDDTDINIASITFDRTNESCRTDVLNIALEGASFSTELQPSVLLIDGSIVTDEYSATTLAGNFVSNERSSENIILLNFYQNEVTGPKITDVFVKALDPSENQDVIFVETYAEETASPLPEDIIFDTDVIVGFNKSIRSIEDGTQIVSMGLMKSASVDVSAECPDDSVVSEEDLQEIYDVTLRGSVPQRDQESNVIAFTLAQGTKLEPSSRYQVCKMIGVVEVASDTNQPLIFDDLNFNAFNENDDGVESSSSIDAAFITSADVPKILKFMPDSSEPVPTDADVAVLVGNFDGEVDDCSKLSLLDASGQVVAMARPESEAIGEDNSLNCIFDTKGNLGPPLLEPGTVYTIRVPQGAFVNEDGLTSGALQEYMFETKREVALIIGEETTRVSEITDNGNFEGIEVEIPTPAGPIIIPIAPGELQEACSDIQTAGACFEQIADGTAPIENIVREVLDGLNPDNDNGDETDGEMQPEGPILGGITEPALQLITDVTDAIDELVPGVGDGNTPGLSDAVETIVDGSDDLGGVGLNDAVEFVDEGLDQVIEGIESVLGGGQDEGENGNAVPVPVPDPITENTPTEVTDPIDEGFEAAEGIGDDLGNIVDDIGEGANDLVTGIGDAVLGSENPVIPGDLAAPINDLTGDIGDRVEDVTNGVSNGVRRVYKVIYTPFGTIYKRIR